MLNLKNLRYKILKYTTLHFYIWGRKMSKDPVVRRSYQNAAKEETKTPSRTQVINFLLSLHDKPTSYLEIGVRYPSDNFEHIEADEKFGIDPGLEFPENPVDFKMTSDAFFEKLSHGDVLDPNKRFDVIFIDGLHLASQANRDITNALKIIKPSGFIVLHDCNPPSHWHARELFNFELSPAKLAWNGTTWKAFLRWRTKPEVYSCCIDTDWGIGVISKNYPIGSHIHPVNEFFEYEELDQNRKEYLNLITFEEFKNSILADINQI